MFIRLIPVSRSFALFALISFIGAFVVVQYYNAQPGYTDAFYHYNAAQRIAVGEGFVDEYLWVYTGLPEKLPAPSHLYWMPGTSILAAIGMALFGQTYAAAQVGFALCLWGATLLTYVIGRKIGGTVRHAWFAGIMLFFGGAYLRFWGIMDTFAPYAFFGALYLFAMGQALTVSDKKWRWWLLAGIAAGAGHLIRNDGLLLLFVGVWCLLLELVFSWSGRTQRAGTQPAASASDNIRHLLMFAGIFITGYLIIMTPWFIRNLQVSDAILPVGGTRAIWYLSYNDLFNYPPSADATRFFEQGGIDFLISTRMSAIFDNDGAIMAFIAEQGMIILTPFMLIALWQQRRNPFFRAMIWFFIGVHLAFILLFPFPGNRGGRFHAVIALIPFWTALALVGLDSVIDWLAKRRSTWNPRTAKPVFSAGMVLIVVIFSLTLAKRTPIQNPSIYPLLDETLPEDARIMINDPAQLYYYTERSGVVIPNESPDVIPEIAAIYDIDYLLIE
ncbi:MAG: ArnT family glycosyltransferase, partial [Aggregatilineales bacterium]